MKLNMHEVLLVCGQAAYIKVDLDAFSQNWNLHKQILQDHGCTDTGRSSVARGVLFSCGKMSVES